MKLIIDIPNEVYDWHVNGFPDEEDAVRLLDIVKNGPPLPKGHWINTPDYLTCAYGCIGYVKCSECGEDSLEEGDFCPNCGAYMGGAE